MADATMGDPPTDSASAGAKRKHPSPSGDGDKAPWLFSFRASAPRSEADRAIAVSPKKDGSAMVVYQDKLPENYRDHILIGSMDNYIFLKNRDEILLVDPFSSSSSWTVVTSFPRRILDPKWRPDDIGNNVAKVVTHGGIAVALVGLSRNRLVYMPLESSSGRRCWIVRDKMISSWGPFSDVIHRKEDDDLLFYALSSFGHQVVALKFVSASDIRDDDEDFEIQDMTLNLRPGFDDQVNYGWCCLQFGHLVDSPSGLFIVRWRLLLKRGEQKRREIDVYKLSADKKMWETVVSLDNYSFFLGMNQSFVASPKDFPGLRGNLIYIPFDAFFLIDPGFERVRYYMDEVDYNWIYDVPGNCWGQWD